MKDDYVIPEDTYINLLAPLLTVLTIICLVFYCFSFTSHASSGVANNLPVEFTNLESYNSMLYSDIYSEIYSANLPIYDSNYVLVVRDFGFLGRDGNNYFYNLSFNLVPIDTFSNVSNGFNWHTDTLSFTKNTDLDTYYFDVHYDFYHNTTPTVHNISTTVGVNITSLFGDDPEYLPNDQVTFCSNCPAYFNKNFFTVSGIKVLKFDDTLPVPEDDIIPENSSKPSIEDYIPEWENSPSFDNSNPFESIFDMSKWVGENLKDTITGTGNYIADSFDYAGQKIIDNIRNTINDVKDTVEDFKDSVVETYEYITEPISVSDLVDTVEGTNLYGTVNTVTTSVTTFTGNFNNLSAPETFKIPIHLENLPEEYFGIQTTQYFDLGWYSQFFPGLRTFTWCFVTFGLFYTVISSFISMVKGG